MRTSTSTSTVITLAALLAMSACGSSTSSADAPTSGSVASTAPADDTASAGSQAPPGDKSGVDVPTLEITMAGEQNAGRWETQSLLDFADRVESLSEGAITVNMRLDQEQASDPPRHMTADGVQDGTYDIAGIPTREWSLEGADSLEALQAPLLIRTRAQASAVLADDGLIQPMLDGLSSAGVVGLAVVPDGFRWLFEKSDHPAQASELAGMVIAAPLAKAPNSYYESLGMTVEPWGNGTDAREATPELQSLLEEGTIVSNAPVYFKFISIVANSDFWDGLSADQQSILRQAAAETQTAFADNAGLDPGVDKGLATYCARGGQVAPLDDAGAEVFADAGAAIVEAMKADSATADRIAQIDALADSTGYESLATCDQNNPPVSSSPTSTALDGTYRFEVTDDDLRTADIPEKDWTYDVGVYTYTLDGDTFRWNQQPAGSTEVGSLEGSGTLDVQGDEVTFSEIDTATGTEVVVTVHWVAADDGSLSFSVVDNPGELNFVRFVYGEPWIKID